MKYTERFFEFPIRIYDRFTAEKAETIEKMKDIPQEGDWAAGKIKIPHNEITTWCDYFDSTQGVDGVREEGFKYTLVSTEHEGCCICVWEKRKFEQKLDEYVTKYEAYANELIENLTVKQNNS